MQARRLWSVLFLTGLCVCSPSKQTTPSEAGEGDPPSETGEPGEPGETDDTGDTAPPGGPTLEERLYEWAHPAAGHRLAAFYAGASGVADLGATRHLNYGIATDGYVVGGAFWEDIVTPTVGAGMSRIWIHNPCGWYTETEMSGTQCYEASHPELTDGQEDLSHVPDSIPEFAAALAEVGVTLTMYAGTYDAHRGHGPLALRDSFREIEPNWDIRVPAGENPAAPGWDYIDGHFNTRGSFIPSDRHQALIDAVQAKIDRIDPGAPTRGWAGWVEDMEAIQATTEYGTAEHEYLRILLESLQPYADGAVPGIGFDSASASPPESLHYHWTKLLLWHGVEVLIEPLGQGTPFWPEGDAWAIFGQATSQVYWENNGHKEQIFQEEEIEGSILVIGDASGEIDGSDWPSYVDVVVDWINGHEKRVYTVRFSKHIEDLRGYEAIEDLADYYARIE